VRRSTTPKGIVSYILGLCINPASLLRHIVRQIRTGTKR
jgi:hypothetical protein